MTPEAQNLIVELVRWVIETVSKAAAGPPAPTSEELRAKVQAAITAHVQDAGWLDAALKLADARFAKP